MKIWLRRAEVDHDQRGSEKPSDHAPVWIELAQPGAWDPAARLAAPGTC